VASSIAWESEPVTVTANQALAAADAKGSGDRTEATEAEEFLRGMLAGRLVAATEVRREANSAGFSWATVRRAKKRLGIRATRRAESGDGLGGRGHWYWSLPSSPAP